MIAVASDGPEQILDENQKLSRCCMSNPAAFNCLTCQRMQQLSFKTGQRRYGTFISLLETTATVLLPPAAIATQQAEALERCPSIDWPADTVAVNACLL
jgi:hypothetical protein